MVAMLRGQKNSPKTVPHDMELSMTPDYNLLCQTRSLYNEPYHTVRPLLPIRMQHGSRMIEWAAHTFGPAGERVRGLWAKL
jgi:hypothetical protein